MNGIMTALIELRNTLVNKGHFTQAHHKVLEAAFLEVSAMEATIKNQSIQIQEQESSIGNLEKHVNEQAEEIKTAECALAYWKSKFRTSEQDIASLQVKICNLEQVNGGGYDKQKNLLMVQVEKLKNELAEAGANLARHKWRIEEQDKAIEKLKTMNGNLVDQWNGKDVNNANQLFELTKAALTGVVNRRSLNPELAKNAGQSAYLAAVSAFECFSKGANVLEGKEQVKSKAELFRDALLTLNLKVRHQGIAFGNCWYSHERMAALPADELNRGKGSIVQQQYAKWVHNVLNVLYSGNDIIEDGESFKIEAGAPSEYST